MKIIYFVQYSRNNWCLKLFITIVSYLSEITLGESNIFSLKWINSSVIKQRITRWEITLKACKNFKFTTVMLRQPHYFASGAFFHAVIVLLPLVNQRPGENVSRRQTIEPHYLVLHNDSVNSPSALPRHPIFEHCGHSKRRGYTPRMIRRATKNHAGRSHVASLCPPIQSQEFTDDIRETYETSLHHFASTTTLSVTFDKQEQN